MAKTIGITCFSPTGTTRTICKAVAKGMGSENPKMLDMTFPDTRAAITANPSIALDGIDHLIVGAPVYVGKLPPLVQECLKTLHGNGKECTAIVVYGNRDYGVSLHKMAGILLEDGFTVVAAATFIGHHSVSDIIPVAVGRPDNSDIKKAMEFGANLLSASRQLSIKDIPLQMDFASKSCTYSMDKPFYDEGLCSQCGECAEVCPLGLISADTGKYFSEAAQKQCLGCKACVKSCAPKARATKVNPIMKMILKIILRNASRERREPAIIL